MAQAKAAGHVNADAVHDFEAHKSFFDRREFTVEFQDGIFVPAEFDQLDEILKELGRMQCRILEAPADSAGFVTTDRPVTLFRRDGMHPAPEHPVNFGHPDSLVLFPLSPRLIALGDPASCNGKVPLLPIVRALVGRFNFTMVRVSPIGIKEPGMIGVMEPVSGEENGIPSGVKNGRVWQRRQGPICERAEPPSGCGRRVHRAPCSRRCDAADRRWLRPGAGCSERPGPIRQSRGCS